MLVLYPIVPGRSVWRKPQKFLQSRPIFARILPGFYRDILNSPAHIPYTVPAMIRSKTSKLLMLGALVSTATCLSPAWAEKWSDASGKFNIEAEYVGVEGKNLVLKKPDGSTISVPISKLSAASREQAKQLYAARKAGGAAKAAATPKMAATTPGIVPVAVEPPVVENLNFTPPTPPAIPPLPAFPENASLQQTFDFVKTQLLAGHPEVFWHALPQSLRDAIDSEQFRAEIAKGLESQQAMGDGLQQVMLKVAEVLVTKKDFILNSQMMSQVPPPLMPLIHQGYDPAVGIFYESAVLSKSTEKMATMAMTDWVNAYGPRIGGHAQALLKMAPPQMIDSFVQGITIQENGDTGSITSPGQNGEPETTEMVRYEGRWVPKDLGDRLKESEGNLTESLTAFAQDSQQQNAANIEQTQMMSGMMVGMAEGALTPLLAAKTQEEFDLGLQQTMAAIGMLGGFGGPGGPGGAGGPGFGAPDGAPGFGAPDGAPGFGAPEVDAPEVGNDL
jgi:SLA1 homology domain 1, SHD1